LLTAFDLAEKEMNGNIKFVIEFRKPIVKKDEPIEKIQEFVKSSDEQHHHHHHDHHKHHDEKKAWKKEKKEKKKIEKKNKEKT